MNKKNIRSVTELVHLIVDIQISLAANPPLSTRDDQRFRHRAVLLNELVFAVHRDGEMITDEDVKLQFNTELNNLRQRIYSLEQDVYKSKLTRKKVKT